jgi:spore coat protein JB
MAQYLYGGNGLNNKSVPEQAECTYKQGYLEQCAPLAAAFIPTQGENPPKYSNDEALTRGTLFPGLDLPFMNVANKNNPYAGTHLGDLMAVDFALKELNLYLDTHQDDTEAFEMLKSVIALSRQAHEKYVKLHGPIVLSDLESFDSYTWIHGPWPWEFEVNEVTD